MSDRIPLLVLTGFPGAGKSTLLSHWLADPEFGEAAVILNELGRVGIDPFLVGAAPVVRAEEEGCICCTLRGALGTALEELVLQRMHRRVAPFTRVVVETTGLAEPGPILEELARNRLVSESYRLEGVVTAVDAVEGEREIEQRHEALAQVLAADTLVMTKADLADAEDMQRLQLRLAAANPRAPLIRSSQGNADPRRVMEALRRAAGPGERPRPGAAAEDRALAPAPSLAEIHGFGLQAVTLRPEAMDAATLRSRLEAFLEHHGDHVMRIKGLVAIKGLPRPAVIHAVAGVLYPVRLLPRWPEGAASALVIIAQDVPEDALLAALAAG